MALEITGASWREVRRHGEEAYPHESCGVLLGSTGDDGVRWVGAVRRCRNTCTESPQDRYRIDPGELVRIQRTALADGHEVIGFYHSHPDGAAYWSATDLAEAHWFGCSYVITNVQKGRAIHTRSFVLGGDDSTTFFEDEVIDLRDTGLGARPHEGSPDGQIGSKERR
jgi:proteasome lid subunit RPN8/RPN11